MATRMLIDARHPEETRVAVLKGNRIEEFDFESAEHKQIKGNIYLAKVTRVEPSLQAAFVDFGGNRHGFLAFSEIHPDYYQIPQQDREALLAEEQAHAEEEAALRAEEDDEEDAGSFEHGAADRAESDEDDLDGVEEIDTSEADQVSTIEDGRIENGSEDGDEDADNGEAAEGEPAEEEGETRGRGRGRRPRRQGAEGGNRGPQGARAKEMDALREKRQALRRRYKIQDVIQRRQVLLVQVVKEERGNKGAALTTYLSLAGRYCVLMPNSSHGGGISRKISSASDRKRLKQIVGELSLPRSMGLIVRTAGLQRTKPEIKRDFDYLARLWDEIRETTLGSSAPALIHSDSDLIKRAIRDIYNRDIEEVVVEGEEGFRSARSFMKLLMPSHVKRVTAYSDPVPLFQRYGAEDQLSAMYDPVVQLKSGGYLVINPTEALVSIDINSGRSTKEHGIEQTALNTNLEAAREIARQLRLRDMAGLVVIDFIDMEYGSNVRKVEKTMKDALKNDRARIQVGRISGFGLMEMSRQRLRTGVLEATTRSCPHCDGTGLVRTASSAGLSALRLIEDEAAKGRGTTITLYASTEAAVYLLNAKRADLAEIESRYGVNVEVIPEGEDEGAKMRVGSSGPRPTVTPRFEPIAHEVDDFDDLSDEEDEEEDDEEELGQEELSGEEREAEPAREDGSESDDESADSRKKRRRRRRGGRNRNKRHPGEEGDVDAAEDEEQEDAAAEDRAAEEQATEDQGEGPAEEAAVEERTSEDEDAGEAPRKRRRRNGRRRRREEGEPQADEAQEADTTEVPETADAQGEERAGEPQEDLAAASAAEEQAPEPAPEAAAAEEAVEEKPRKRTRRRKTDADVSDTGDAVAAAETAAEGAAQTTADSAVETGAEKPKRTRRRKAAEPKAAEPAEADATEAAKPATKRPRTRKSKVQADTAIESAAPEPAAEPVGEEARPAPAPEPVPAASSADGESAVAVTADTDASNGDAGSSDGPRRGWWQRTFGN
jgi:ribonuclease E